MVPDSLSRLVVAPSAIYALLIAAVITFALTPVAMRAAWRLGVVDRPGGRRIHDRPIPLLGGVAIFLGIVVAVLPNLEVDRRYASILIGAGLICLLGVVDDRFGIPPLPKLLGQIACAAIPVATGMTIDSITIPLIEPSTVSFGVLAYPLTIIFIVAVANVVNLADGMDGLAAGVCGISALTFAILALSLGRISAGVMAAAVAGACLGFLPWNFNPAKVFMGDSGALVLGFLLACVSIQGVMKTAAALSLVFPLVVLLVPILDTSFVILKRLKSGQSIASADKNHFHHRLLRVGYTQRQAVGLLYAWSAVLAAFALAIRLFPYRTEGTWNLWPSIGLTLFGLIALFVTYYVVVALEIIKYRHLRRFGLLRRSTATDETPLPRPSLRRRSRA
ncbi:MAG: undecaprenyl-phosphate alpha-N-acetylglucosaminyl 1-phosphate transferase [Thermoleophilia bacterium]|nr:MAG: undecaprenyl-phosphate alpha-N-acetylglucosaminyl 1-phosphate transferase [Thermoleophilia bacterium]